ncbi:hypothetical protein BDV25DRAFT_145601 [Aspergillus avenaceus]|uniref:Uncharacterized protein n=1 Tax=Aspergillus avenaceus TaxID=36643 RepID=A0A5N6TDZ3_ASPAV|nr:hypothetical protein BDV25DRAFT_145601 [Aspergillus avenaceus]
MNNHSLPFQQGFFWDLELSNHWDNALSDLLINDLLTLPEPSSYNPDLQQPLLDSFPATVSEQPYTNPWSLTQPDTDVSMDYPMVDHDSVAYPQVDVLRNHAADGRSQSMASSGLTPVSTMEMGRPKSAAPRKAKKGCKSSKSSGSDRGDRSYKCRHEDYVHHLGFRRLSDLSRHVETLHENPKQ